MVGNTGVGHELRQEVLSTQVMAVGQQAFLKKMQPRHSRHTSTKPPDSMEPESVSYTHLTLPTNHRV